MRILLLSIITLTFIMTATPPIYAITPRMESPLYRIDWGNINIGGQDQESEGYNLSTTLGQTAAGQFQSDGYVVKAGFQYVRSIIPFQFTVSNTTISFGELIPHVPATGKTTLTVSFGSAGQYQVTAAELGPLQTLNGTTIPDTACDGGTENCTESVAKLWTTNGTYGFGYTLSGHDIPSDFVNEDYFRPFADKTADESPSVIMSNSNVGRNRQATMTFKVNISAIQPAGSYQTIVQYVATPTF